MQLSYVLFFSLDLCGLQTYNLLRHIVLLFLAVALWYMATVMTLVTTWCSKGAQGPPPGRCPACSSPGYIDLVFVDLENVGGFCKPSCIVPQEPFLLHPCWYGTAPSLGPVFSLLFLLFLVSLIVALHFSLAAGLQREVSQLATATYARHHHPPQARDTGAFRPRAGPWAESMVALGTAAWPQEQGYCMTSAGEVLSPPPNCTC